MGAPTDQSLRRPRANVPLFFGILGGPFAMFLQGAINFVMIPWACGAGMQSSLWIVELLCLAVAIAASFVCWREWHRIGAEWEAQGPGAVPRARFMSILGFCISAASAIVIVAQSLPTFFLGACQ